MELSLSFGNRGAFVSSDADASRYAYSHALRTTARVGVGTLVTARRALVEVHHRVGGNPQRALVGGVLLPAAGDALELEVRLSGSITLGATPSYQGALGRHLVPGLPDEIGGAVEVALFAGIKCAGHFTVDRAAYDEVESSSHIFGVAAGLLALVLAFDSPEAAEAAVQDNLRSWQ